MSESAPPPPPRKCASCLYDLTGVTSPTCPECGYTPTPAELALAERRAVFIELTRFRQWAGFFWILLPFVAVYFLTGTGHIALVISVIAAASLAWSEIAGRTLVNDTPRGQLPIVRRAWRMSLLWLHLPATFAAYTLAFFYVMDYFTHFTWRFVSSTQWIKVFTGATATSAIVGLLIAWPMWRRSMRRLLRVAGATDDVRQLSHYAYAGKWAMRPAAIVVALPAFAIALNWLLDTFIPNWWR